MTANAARQKRFKARQKFAADKGRQLATAVCYWAFLQENGGTPDAVNELRKEMMATAQELGGAVLTASANGI